MTPPETVRSSPTVKSLFVVIPVSATCVKFVSESAPKFIMAPSDPSVRSSGNVTSLLLSSNTALLAVVYRIQSLCLMKSQQHYHC